MPQTFMGIGTTYYGATDRGFDGSFVTTEWFVFAGVPVLPLRSYRVLPMGGDYHYNVLGSKTTTRYLVERAPLRGRQVLATWGLFLPLPVITGGTLAIFLALPGGRTATDNEATIGVILSFAFILSFWVGPKLFLKPR